MSCITPVPFGWACPPASSPASFASRLGGMSLASPSHRSSHSKVTWEENAMMGRWPRKIVQPAQHTYQQHAFAEICWHNGSRSPDRDIVTPVSYHSMASVRLFSRCRPSTFFLCH